MISAFLKSVRDRTAGILLTDVAMHVEHLSRTYNQYKQGYCYGCIKRCFPEMWLMPHAWKHSRSGWTGL